MAETVSKKFNHGLIVGKFLPVHKGHLFLIDSTLAQVTHLTIVVFSEPTEPIPGNTRVRWLKTLYPTVSIAHYDKPLPRDQSGTDNWQIWLAALQSVTNQPQFDAVFSSEPYGQRLAADFSAQHVLVDHNRTQFPVSGREILVNPKKFQSFLPDLVRKYFNLT